MTLTKKVLIILYSIFAKNLPQSSHARLCGRIRRYFAKHIIEKCGKNVNVEKGATIRPGLKIGDNSGIGIDAEIYGDVTIGESVMMGPEVVIYTQNHKHELSDIPFGRQGFESVKPVNIGNNVWIGRRVMFMVGSGCGNNVIVAAGSVVTKVFPSNVVIGGAPAKIIKHLGEING